MGLTVEEWELDLEIREMIDAWLDFEEFGILPWDRNTPAKDILPYWKNGIRFISQMRTQAKQNVSQNSKGKTTMKMDSELEQRRRRIGN